MAKVLLTTLGDEEALGIRALATRLEASGHKVLLLYLGSFISNIKAWQGEDIGHDKYMVVTDSGDITTWSNPLKNIDAESYRLYEEEIKKFNPDIIGFSGRSFFDDNITPFFARLKKAAPDAWLVSGGHGPTFSPQSYLVNGDFVIRGEGEEALMALAESRDNNSLAQARSIANIAYKDNAGALVSNPLAPSGTSEEEFPDFPFLYGRATVHIINSKRYENNEHTKGYYTLGGRGCLMSCSYCGGGNWTKIYSGCGIKMPKRRRRPLASVLKELLAVKNSREIGFVHFCDEHFAYPREDLLAFFREYKEQIAIPFFLYFHAAQIVSHPEILEAAVEAGLHQASLGIQTGDSDFALNIYNRKNQNDVIRACAALFARNNIFCDYQFIQGSPWETKEKIFRDYRYIESLPYNGSMQRLIFTWFTPHKGAPILEKCLTGGGRLRSSVNEYLLNSLFLGLARFKPLSETRELYDDPTIRANPRLLAPMLKSEFAKLAKPSAIQTSHGLNS